MDTRTLCPNQNTKLYLNSILAAEGIIAAGDNQVKWFANDWWGGSVIWIII